MKRIRTALLVLLAAVGMAGCSVAEPDSSQRVLHYTGGPFSSQVFEYCVEPGVRTIGGVSDYDFYYPNGQRTFTFRSDPANEGVPAAGADAPSIRVGTKNQTELIVSGSLTFTLNPDCAPITDEAGKVIWPGGVLQQFHDTIGRQKVAYSEEGSAQQPAGWFDVLRLYVGGPAERSMDTAGLDYEWQQLYSDADSRNAWAADVALKLKGGVGPDGKPVVGMIEQQAGGPFFLISNVQLDNPTVPAALRAELEANQAAQLRKNTADTDQASALNFPGGLNGYLEYQRQQAINKAIQEGRVNPLIVPQGSPVIVGPGVR